MCFALGAERDVRHPLQRDVSGLIGERASVRSTEPLFVRHLPIELISDQHAVADDIPRLRLDALVVVADGREAVLDLAIAGHVHHRRAELQRVELVERRERRARVVRLIAEHAIELSRVTDRLVDRQPQVRRIDDDVVAARRDRGRRHLLLEQRRNFVGVLREVVDVREVLPALPGWRRRAPHRLERACGFVDADRSEIALHAHALLRDARAGQRGEVLLLAHEHRVGRDAIDQLRRERPVVEREQKVDLVLFGHRERIDLVTGDVRGVIDRLVGQRHRFGVERRQRFGHPDGPARDAGDRVKSGRCRRQIPRRLWRQLAR